MKENKIIFDWYRKYISSDRFLNYTFCHTKSHKIGIIYTLVDKICKLSDKRFHYVNFSKIKNFLIHNAYPINFIDHYIKKRIKYLHYIANIDAIEVINLQQIIKKKK